MDAKNIYDQLLQDAQDVYASLDPRLLLAKLEAALKEVRACV